MSTRPFALACVLALAMTGCPAKREEPLPNAETAHSEHAPAPASAHAEAVQEGASAASMPITVPSISIQEARRLLQWQDGEIKKLPEVERVFGKTGRAETSLDPAPLSMFETVVRLKPKSEWRTGMTQEKIIAELEKRASLPGVQSAWTMPIKARIDMLSTGIRTPIGVKVFGSRTRGRRPGRRRDLRATRGATA